VNCRRVNSLLSAYIDRELGGADQLQIRDHLRQCDTCAREHDSLLITKRLLSGLAVQEPRPDLETAILQRLSAESRRPGRLSMLSGWWCLLTEGERLRYRVAGLCASLAAAGLVLTASPWRSHQAQLPMQPMIAERPAPPVSPSFVRDLAFFHRNREDAHPMNAAPFIVPSSAIGPVSFDSAR